MTKLEYFKAKIESSLAPVDIIRMTPEQRESYLFVDVRMAPAHIMTHKVKEAVMIPLDSLAERLDEIPRDKTIVVYGWGEWDNIAAKAAVILLENGIDAVELSGGFVAWQTMKFEIETVA